MKKNQTTLILISSFIIAVLAVGLFAFFLKVIKNKNQHISVVLSTLEEKIKEKEKEMMFAEKIVEIKSLQDSIDSHFLDPDKIDTFVGYLEQIGPAIGSLVSVESIAMPSKTDNIILVKILISGTFQEVMRTITYLENTQYQINVTQIYLNKNTEQSYSNGSSVVKPNRTWQANVSFDILSKK